MVKVILSLSGETPGGLTNAKLLVAEGTKARRATFDDIHWLGYASTNDGANRKRASSPNKPNSDS